MQPLILPWSSQVQWQEILLWVFHSSVWAFCASSQAPLGRSLWSGHHGNDLFLLQKLRIDDGNFGQKWRRQKWKKGQGSSRPVTGGTGVHGLISQTNIISFAFDLKAESIKWILKVMQPNLGRAATTSPQRPKFPSQINLLCATTSCNRVFNLL